MLRDDITAASRAHRIMLDPFNYVIDFNVLAASAVNQQGNFTVNADSDFVILYSMIAAFSSVTVEVTRPNYLFTTLDTGSGRNLENTSNHVLNGFGTAQLPYLWPEPKLLVGAANFVILLTNLTVTAARVIMTFAGFKVFYMKGYDRNTAFYLA